MAEFGENPKHLTRRSASTETRFVAYGKENRTQHFHRALIGPNLKPHTAYFYRVGSNITLPNLYFCTSFDGAADWAPHLALFGDMGNTNAKSIPALQRDIQVSK